MQNLMSDMKKRPSSSEDERSVLHRTPAVPPHLAQLANKKSAGDGGKTTGMPASLTAGTALLPYRKSDTLCPDNGGDSVPDYSPQGAFGGQLPGPFTTCADIGLSPFPDSLNPALAATNPDLGRCCMHLYGREYTTSRPSCQIDFRTPKPLYRCGLSFDSSFSLGI